MILVLTFMNLAIPVTFLQRSATEGGLTQVELGGANAGIVAEIGLIMRQCLEDMDADNYECCTPSEPPDSLSTQTFEDSAESEAIWTGWTFFESGKDSWWQVGGDGGNAYGRFQLDARHSLAGFLRYAVESNPSFVGLERYYRKGESGTVLGPLEGLDHDWAWLCAVYGEEFYQVQAEFAYGTFYCSMRDKLLDECGIDLRAYGPVLKGTVWSVAVRNGNNLSSLYSVIDTYYPGISEEEWLKQIYAVEEWRHPDQIKRWGEGQRNAALETLHKLNGGTEVEFHRTFEKEAGQDTERIELLSLAGDYRDFLCYTEKIAD